METLIDVLQHRVRTTPDEIVYRFLVDGEDNEQTLTYGELDRKARVVSFEILQKCSPGARALLIYPSGLDFIVAFLACFYSKVIAVPAYPPRKNHKLERLSLVFQDSLFEKRVNFRYPLTLPTEILIGEKSIKGITENISIEFASIEVEDLDDLSDCCKGDTGIVFFTLPNDEVIELDCKIVKTFSTRLVVVYKEERVLIGRSCFIQSLDVDSLGMILTNTQTFGLAEDKFSKMESLKDLPVLKTDSVDESRSPGDCKPLKIVSNDTAFLQYTSGSTGNPKGVMVSHQNIMANCLSIAHSGEIDERSCSVSWLPMFHDMGLIYGIFLPLYAGIQAILMDPLSFLQQPFRWLVAISKYQATHSVAPNFAYELCSNVVNESELSKLDLSTWRVAFNGAEPISAETLRKFAQKFSVCGFHPKTAYPCYGMAEATLIITGSKVSSLPNVLYLDTKKFSSNHIVVVDETQMDHKKVKQLVGCGYACCGHEVIIVDTQTRDECSEHTIGEVWFSGPSVTQGYWDKPGLTTEIFHAYTNGGKGPYLRTGDLGFLHKEELYVTGRFKDLIIIGGKNYYPQDIEMIVSESHESLVINGSVAFSIYTEEGEGVVVFQEIQRTYVRKVDKSKVIQAILKAVSTQYALGLHGIVLLKPGRLPRTSSGKVQRFQCKYDYFYYLFGEIESLGMWDKDICPLPTISSQEIYKAPKNEIEEKLAAAWCQVLRLERVGVHDAFLEVGGTSILASVLNKLLTEEFCREFEIADIFEHPTVATFADFIEQGAPQLDIVSRSQVQSSSNAKKRKNARDKRKKRSKK